MVGTGHRWLRLRTSRRLYQVVVLVAIVMSLAGILYLGLDHFLQSDPKGTSVPLNGRYFGLATKEPYAMQQLNGENLPFFHACPASNGLWKVTFSWWISVAENEQDFVKSAPPLYVIAPASLTKIEPELELGVSLEREEEILRSRDPLTSLTVLRKTASETLLELRPTRVITAPGVFNHPTAYYGVKFWTEAFTLERDGIGGHRFRLGYQPNAAKKYGLVPGFGGATLRNHSSPGSLNVVLCQDSWRRGVDVPIDQLLPHPTENIGAGKVAWSIGIQRSWVVDGKFSGGMFNEIRKISSWLVPNSIAAALGAIYGAGIEPRSIPRPENPSAGTRSPVPKSSRKAAPDATQLRSATPMRKDKGKRKRGRR